VTVAVLLGYLAAVLSLGLLSRRLSRGTGEDFFLATRTIGPFMLLMSLFGTHMTAFSLLGASGEAYRSGIGVFSLMASSSAIVVPVVFYFVGVRLWSVGKRGRFTTQVEYFRRRWDSPGLGLLLFCVLTALLIPYLLIGVLGGGLAMEQITGGSIPKWLGSLLVCVVVMGYVTSGGLRGTAWANTFQTLVFMVLGAVTFIYITGQLGGLDEVMRRLQAEAPRLLIRGDAISPVKMATYAFIPLSVGMFPHIFMHWLTARRASSFRLSMVAYPICIAIVWLPSVLLGVAGAVDQPGLVGPASNSILVKMIDGHAPELLAGLLGAGVFAAIMSSLDSQVLSLGTMFTHDIVRFYGFGERMDERKQVLFGRLFVSGLLVVAFVLSQIVSPSIFKLGVWCFTGFAGLFPLVVAAVYWRRCTRQGALAAVVVVAALWSFFFYRGLNVPGYTVGNSGVMPVAVIVVACALTLVVVSTMTKAPADDRLELFFPKRVGP